MNLAATSTEAPPIGAGEMLATLLGVEALLVAAVSIAIALVTSSGIGDKWKVSPAALAITTTVILGLITIGAGFLWVQLFGGSAWPEDCELRVGAIALAIAIVAPPLLSVLLSINVKCGR